MSRAVEPDAVIAAAGAVDSALRPFLDADWSVPAGNVEWSVEQTIVHLIGAPAKYTLYLASRSPRFIALNMAAWPDATHEELVASIVPVATGLAAVAGATPSDVRAFHADGPMAPGDFPKGLAGDKVHQKRVPSGAPPWLETVRVHFPRYDRDADELCVTKLADVIWAVQMSTVEFHPWNSRRADTERPDEWRIDLDPGPECGYDRVRRAAHVVHALLDELGAVGWPKTSGGAGLHVYVRIEPRWGFGEVRRGALAFAREVQRRAPDDVTTTWWRKDRHPARVFVDYNQNARDHTIASAYSVRGIPDARVSTPIGWEEIDTADPRDFTIATIPARFAELGDLHGGIDEAVFRIEPLLEWAERDDREGEVDPGSGA